MADGRGDLVESWKPGVQLWPSGADASGVVSGFFNGSTGWSFIQQEAPCKHRFRQGPAHLHRRRRERPGRGHIRRPALRAIQGACRQAPATCRPQSWGLVTQRWSEYVVTATGPSPGRHRWARRLRLRSDQCRLGSLRERGRSSTSVTRVGPISTSSYGQAPPMARQGATSEAPPVMLLPRTSAHRLSGRQQPSTDKAT